VPQVLFKVAGKPAWDLPVTGTIARQAQGDFLACGKSTSPNMGACTGTKRFDGTIAPVFTNRRRFMMDAVRMPMTTDLYPKCEFVFDSHVGRTGAVLLNHVKGTYDARRFRGRTSYTFRARDRSTCSDETWDITCKTVSTWRISFYPDGKKHRKR
jgi:hypothetical protein